MNMERLNAKIMNRDQAVFNLKSKLKLQDSIIQKFEKLTQTIDTLRDISFFPHPYKKVKAYKNMLTAYHAIKKEPKGS